MPEPSTNQIREALNFSQFRFKLIEFLKLPFDIREPALREVLERTCYGVYRNYLARAERVEKILKSEDTLEMNVRVPLVMDHRQSASQNRQATLPIFAAVIPIDRSVIDLTNVLLPDHHGNELCSADHERN